MNAIIRETVRYLGYGDQAADDMTLQLIRDSLAELDKAAVKRLVCRVFCISGGGEDGIEIGQLHIESRKLKKHLSGCESVILLAATLGVGVDRLMKRYAVTDVSRAVVLQAAAAALLEDYLDEWQKNLAVDYAREGKYLTSRFSPGYGDLGLESQEMLLRMLDAGKRIGLSVTDGLMLAPTKSVTAIIGIREGGNDSTAGCAAGGCASCEKYDCAYRRI